MIKVVASPEELNPNTPLDIEIRIVNHSRKAGLFGEDANPPWLQITRIDDLEMGPEWIGHGESIPPFRVEPGETHVLKRSIELDGRPPGRYLLQFDGHLKDCDTFPVFHVPAMVQLLPVR